MSPEERSESARIAARARWGTRPEEKKGTGADLVTFDFHGDALECLPATGKLWVVVRRVCEALKINADGQRVKLSSKAWACTEMISVQLPGDAQSRETFCIDLDSLPMWLATIEASRVAEAIRPKLERYQVECARVLREHFLGQRIPDPFSAKMTAAEITLRLAQDVVDLERRQNVVEHEIAQLKSGHNMLEADVDQLRQELNERTTKRSESADSSLDSEPDFVPWAKSLEGGLAGAQTLALAQIAALQKLRLGFLAPLAVAVRALENGDREAAESAIATAMRETEGQRLTIQQLLLVGLSEARRLITVAYRYAYVGYKPGLRDIAYNKAIPLSQPITPRSYPLHIVFVNGEGLTISGPVFISPNHHRAKDVARPLSAAAWAQEDQTRTKTPPNSKAPAASPPIKDKPIGAEPKKKTVPRASASKELALLLKRRRAPLLFSLLELIGSSGKAGITLIELNKLTHGASANKKTGKTCSMLLQRFLKSAMEKNIKEARFFTKENESRTNGKTIRYRSGSELLGFKADSLIGDLP